MIWCCFGTLCVVVTQWHLKESHMISVQWCHQQLQPNHSLTFVWALTGILWLCRTPFLCTQIWWFYQDPIAISSKQKETAFVYCMPKVHTQTLGVQWENLEYFCFSKFLRTDYYPFWKYEFLTWGFAHDHNTCVTNVSKTEQVSYFHLWLYLWNYYKQNV